VRRKRELALNCREEPVSGAGERDEERIALRVDLVSPVRIEGCPEQALVLVENVAVMLPKLFDESRRPFDIREEKGDRAAWQFRHKGKRDTAPTWRATSGLDKRGTYHLDMTEDEWRVEIDLDDEEHGYGLGERLRSRALDDAARERLGRRVMVTRDGPRVFLYAGTEEETREAERIARELVSEEDLTAEVRATRWHPVEEAWKDASIPLPRTDAEEEEELDRKEAADWQEAVEEGSFDWMVKVQLPSGAEAAELADRLSKEGYQVHRRWRYLTIDVVTEERASELASSLREVLPPGSEVRVDANPDDIPTPVFVLLESRL
jgi:hypothetical protein